VPLTKKGSKILSSMRAQYGGKKGEQVFYASINKGKIKGAEKSTKRAEGGPVGGRYPLPIVPIYDPVPGRESSSSLVPLKTTKGILPRRPYGENLPERARGGRAEPEKSESPGPPENFYRPSEQTWVYPEYKPLERLSEPIPMKSRYYRARGGRVDAHEAREMQMMREMMQMHPGMAKGGAAGNGAYMVGERGPEMFMPDRPGTIIPHHELTRLARKYGGHVGSYMRARGGSVTAPASGSSPIAPTTACAGSIRPPPAPT